MISVWKDIDPTHAEQQVRNLRLRITSAEHEIESYREFGDISQLSFAYQLAVGSLRKRREELQGRLAEVMSFRTRELVQIALNGPEFPRHSASFGSLAEILHAIQKLFTSVVQATTTGPTTRGPVPGSIAFISKLRLAEVFPSSFGMIVEVGTDQAMPVKLALERSLERVFDLFERSAESDQLLETASALGSRVVSHYRRLISSLHESKTVSKLEWSDASGNFKVWTANNERLTSILGALSDIKTELVEERKETGILVGVSLLRSRFELLSDSGDVVEGQVADNILDKVSVAFATRCLATYTVTQTRNSFTGNSRSVVTLTDIEKIIDTSPTRGLAVFG